MFSWLYFFSLGFSATPYNHYAKWKQPPEVIVCQDSGVNNEMVLSSIEYWKQRGYYTNNTTFLDTCSFKKKKNTIVVYPDYGDVDKDTQYGVTKIQWYDNHIETITIFISEEALNNYNVIKHEFGHAFGIKHVSEKKDIMYPYVDHNIFVSELYPHDEISPKRNRTLMTIKGCVVDDLTQQPVAGAQVVFLKPDTFCYEWLAQDDIYVGATTDKNGCYSFEKEFAQNSVQSLCIKKQGYKMKKMDEIEIDTNENNLELFIDLKRKP